MMKLIGLSQIMILMLFTMAPSLSDGEQKEQNGTSGTKKFEEFSTKHDLLIPAYISAAGPLLIVIHWCLWHIIRKCGLWKKFRPQYMRILIGWVNQVKWDLKRSEQAKRKEANQPTVHCTTKAYYKWKFYDPTGDLKQQYDNQKKQSYLPPKLPLIFRPDVVEVWRISSSPLPELMGRPRLESEPELNGEFESPERQMERDTEHRLQTGRPQVTTNEISHEFRTEIGLVRPVGRTGLPSPPLRPRRVFVHRPLDPEIVPRARLPFRLLRRDAFQQRFEDAQRRFRVLFPHLPTRTLEEGGEEEVEGEEGSREGGDETGTRGPETDDALDPPPPPS